MSFVVVEKPEAAIIAIQGKFLGSVESDDFKSAVDGLKDRDIKHIVIDLSEADFLDSTAIGLLISALTTMRNAGGDVRLSAMNKRVKNLFVLTRLLGPVFEGHETAEEALRAFSEQETT